MKYSLRELMHLPHFPHLPREIGERARAVSLTAGTAALALLASAVLLLGCATPTAAAQSAALAEAGALGAATAGRLDALNHRGHGRRETGTRSQVSVVRA